MEETRAADRGFPPEFVRVLVVASTWSFAFSSTYLLPKFLDRGLAATPSEIGLAVGIFGWATVAFAPHVGQLLDRWSLRRVMLVGAFGTGLTCFGLAAVTTAGPLLYALRIAQAYAHALGFTAVGVAVATLAPPERLSQALGLSGASMLAMNALSPAVLEPIADRFGWPTAFAVAGSMAMVSVLLGLRLPPIRGGGRAAKRGIGEFLGILSRPIARDFAAISAIAGLAFGTMVTFEPPLALELGRSQVRGFFVAYALGALGMRLGLGHLPDRLGRHRVAVTMFAVYSVVVASVGIVPAWLLDVTGLGFGVAHGLFYPSLNAIAVSAVSPEERGRILSVFTGAFYLGFAGPSLLGPLADAAGYRAVFWLVGAVTAAGVVLLARSDALGTAGARTHVPLALKVSRRL
ncbi:MAG: MFS transporter, partial [Candidatus Binatia bacterium]